MRILGIETSCDETSAAIVEDGKNIISNVVFSQIEIHSPFNGVVPEVASRNHLIKIIDVVSEAMGENALSTIDAIAVVNGPGLLGSLLIGLSTAKTLSYTLGIPLIPVNHIYAHMYAPHLFHDIEFPYIGLVASGGHTILFKVEGYDNIELLGTTIDDAVGEAFDKVAKLLGLGYPGGPKIDKAAQGGDTSFMKLPRIMEGKPADRFNYSYSGLKTAVAYRLKEMEINEQVIKDVAASFQKAAVDSLLRKAQYALKDNNIKRLVISGGVAANSYLRNSISAIERKGYRVFTAPAEYCGDNAAMVAGRGFVDYQSGVRGGLSTEAYSRLPIIKKGKRPLET